MRNWKRFVVAGLAAVLAMLANEHGQIATKEAEAYRGRAVGYRGVARRTARRTTRRTMYRHGAYGGYGGYYGGYYGGAAYIGSAAVITSLPSGCATSTTDGIVYYSCSGTWYRPYYQGTTLVYQTVEEP